MRRRTWALTLALSVALASSGCTGDGDDGSERTADGDFSMVSALGELPASEDVVFVSVADVAAVREANGVEVPDLDDDAAVADYALLMTGVDEESVAMLTPPASSQRLDVLDERELLGFSWMQAERLASVYAAPEEFTWTSYAEDVQPAADLTDAGDGLLRPDDGSDLLLEGLLIAADGEEAVVSRSSDHIAAWRAGEAETLADDEGLAALGAALDDAGAISAYLMTAAGDRGALALGWRMEGDEPGFVVAYDAGDAEAANADAAIDGLRTDYEAPVVAEHLEVADVTADGRAVVVTGSMPDRPAQILLQLLLRFDLPLLP